MIARHTRLAVYILLKKNLRIFSTHLSIILEDSVHGQNYCGGGVRRHYNSYQIVLVTFSFTFYSGKLHIMIEDCQIYYNTPVIVISTLVEETEQKISSDCTMVAVGGQCNYNKLIDMMNLYHENELTIANVASELIADISSDSFDYNFCFHSGYLLWKFIKTTETFQKASWYYRDYVIAKILGSRVKVDEIL